MKLPTPDRVLPHYLATLEELGRTPSHRTRQRRNLLTRLAAQELALVAALKVHPERCYPYRGRVYALDEGGRLIRDRKRRLPA